MMRQLYILVVLLVALAGCAVYPDVNRERLLSLPHNYVNFDLVLAWEYREADNRMIIDGVVRNRRFAYMEDVEVWVAVLDARGKSVDRAVGFVIPQMLAMDEVAPFTVKLPKQAPGTRLRFTYKYRGKDGGKDGEGSSVWMQNFETRVPPLK